jgi:LacI family transcriptional regulator
MTQQNKVDGIIGLTYNPQLVVDENTPFVSIDRSMEPKIPCVACDNFTLTSPSDIVFFSI